VTAPGTTFRNLAVTQDHPNPSTTFPTAWTPTTYPYVFNVTTASDVLFQNVLMDGVYAGIKAVTSGRLRIEGLFGQFFMNAVYADESLDSDRWNNIHVWPYWSVNMTVAQQQNVYNYQYAHLDALQLGRADTNYIDNVFVLGARSGLRFSGSPISYDVAATNQFLRTSGRNSIGKFQCDGCTNAIWVDSTVMGPDPNHSSAYGIIGPDAKISQLDFTGTDYGTPPFNPVAASTAIKVDAPPGGAPNNSSNTRLQIGEFRTRYSGGPAVTIAACDVAIEVSQAWMDLWGQDAPTTTPMLSAPNCSGPINAMRIALLRTDFPPNVIFNNVGTNTAYTLGYLPLTGGTIGGSLTVAGFATVGALVMPFHTPASSSEACSAGQFYIDASFIYTCVATNTWHRVANGATW
jgi:hypothetical protein